jgi:hypothetical protein
MTMGASMALASEDDVKKKLGIDSWRNLSKDKFLNFVAEMPQMNKEVALKAIAQFPNFKSLVDETLNSVEQNSANAQKYSWKSQKKVHGAYKSYRKTLDRELDRENLSTEDRFRILEMLREAVNMESEKDSEHKAFQLKLVTIVATVGIAAVGAAVAALGGKAGFGTGDKSA